MRLTKPQFSDLLPHQGNALLIESVENWDEASIECKIENHAHENHPLRHENRLSAVVGIEYAAQAAAIHHGLLSAKNKDKPAAGLLAGVSNLEMHIDRLDNISGPLQMIVTKLIADESRALYEFNLIHGDKKLLNGKFSVVFESALT